MSLYESVLKDVKASPDGPQIGAFFDFDGTVCYGFSAVPFLYEQVKQGEYTPSQVVEIGANMTQFLRKNMDFSTMMAGNAAMQAGKRETDFFRFGETLFEKQIAKIIYPESRALIREHLRKGHTVALISSATRYQLQAATKDLGIKHLCCTEMEVRDGIFTGRVIHPTCYGTGKVRAAEGLAKEYNIDFEQSFFYSDSDEDLPLLEKVGKPRPLNPNSALTKIAEELGWPIQRFSSRGRPTAVDYIRSVAATGSLVASAAATLPIKWLTGSNKRFRNASTSLFADLSSAIVGLDLDVTGEEHLVNRPAVVILNHQSKADVIVIASLLRGNLAGVGKAEIRKMPLIGKVMEIGGVVFVDRKNTASALEAIKPLNDVITKEKRTVVIAPEGTRSVSPKPGRFKKGAFHIAMQTGVPILPIVIHNAHDVAPKGEFLFRPAKVKVDILPPIDVSRWDSQNMDAHVEEVRQLYLETLGFGEKTVTTKKSAAKKRPARKKSATRKPTTKTTEASS